VVTLALRFEGVGAVQKIWGALSYVELCVHQYTNWYQCINLTCTRGTFAVQTWHGLVEQLRCSDYYW